MLVVAGLSLKNLQPRVWDRKSPYYIPDLKAVMVSYGDFHQMPARRKEAMRLGLRAYLKVPKGIAIYLDNGAFYFMKNGQEANARDYREFIDQAQPDWRPVRFDAIPVPQMTNKEQRACLDKTMRMNRAYQHDGFVPVIHVSRLLREYVAAIKHTPRLAAKENIALGGLVPNLLRAPKALSYEQILAALQSVRSDFAGKHIHVFGIGGTATLHIAALLRFDSADSSGWRNRAARGIVQLPGSGDRIVAELGNWRGRRPSSLEWRKLANCRCPACCKFGPKGLSEHRLAGFCHRATHNLWVLLEEAAWLEAQLKKGTYEKSYRRRLDNSIYAPLISCLLRSQSQQGRPGANA